MSKQEKWTQYAVYIQQAIANMFDEDDENYIGESLEEIDLTQFFHALANAVPTVLFNRLTGNKKSQLEFNHIANQLVFQYTKMTDETKTI